MCRHPDLDVKLTSDRHKAEARALLKCKQVIRNTTLKSRNTNKKTSEHIKVDNCHNFLLQIGVACPTLYLADQEQHLLIMQQLEGKTAREAVDQGIAEADVKKLSRIAKLIGERLMKGLKRTLCSVENALHLC